MLFHGSKALVIALLGTLACIAGAAVETSLSGAYNICQFFNFKWGKNRPARSVPVYTASWAAMLVWASVIALTGVRALQLVEISIVFGATRYFSRACPRQERFNTVSPPLGEN